jgi:hypothetical protein
VGAPDASGTALSLRPRSCDRRERRWPSPPAALIIAAVSSIRLGPAVRRWLPLHTATGAIDRRSGFAERPCDAAASSPASRQRRAQRVQPAASRTISSCFMPFTAERRARHAQRSCQGAQRRLSPQGSTSRFTF